MFRTIACSLVTAALSMAAQDSPGNCNAPAASPSVTISLPSSPFMVAPSKDGCWVFVSLLGRNPGMAVLKRSAGNVSLVRTIPLPSGPTGITLTHDGKLLIAAAGDEAIFLDVQQMIDGTSNPVAGSIKGGRGSIYANTTADDNLLFVSEENAQAITVIDLARARRDGYKPEDVIGKIPVGIAPIALTFSPDGKWLYTTSEVAPPDWQWPKACKPEAMRVPDSIVVNPEGAVIVVDVARAKTDPANAFVARVPAGCSPVRMSISPSGDRIYVTARNSNGVFEFDTAKLIHDGEHSIVGIAPAGDAPVPIMVVNNGSRVVVGNSNRFASGNNAQSLVLLDAAKLQEGLSAVLGTIPAGAFPREMAVSTDQRTLFLTNFGSNSLQVMDLAHLPVNPDLPPEIARNAESLAHRHDHKPVTVNPGVLQRYVGVYQAPGRQPIVIGIEGDHLTIQDSRDSAPDAMLPESDTKFFAFGPQVEFPNVPEGGHAEQLTLGADPRMPPQVAASRETVFTRMDDEAAKPVLDAAAAFAKRFKDNTPQPGSEAAVRKIIADIKAGKPDPEMFTTDGQRPLRALTAQIENMGAVKSIVFERVGPAGPDIYQVEAEKGAWAFRIWLTPEGKVDRAMLTPNQQQ